MRMLVATAETQGDVSGDFSRAREGELVVRLPLNCRSDGPGACACGRLFVGAHSGKATTSARVVDSPLSRSAWRVLMRSALDRFGGLGGVDPAEVDRAVGAMMAHDLDAVAGLMPGTVVGRLAWVEDGWTVFDAMVIRR